MHPLHHCLLAICFQAVWVSVVSAESLPTKDISELTASHTRCLMLFKGVDALSQRKLIKITNTKEIITVVQWHYIQRIKSVYCMKSNQVAVRVFLFFLKLSNSFFFQQAFACKTDIHYLRLEMSLFMWCCSHEAYEKQCVTTKSDTHLTHWSQDRDFGWK